MGEQPQKQSQKGDDRQQKGLVLKQVRESKGLTLRMVHDATKIPMDALRAIEEGYTIRTISTFYRRAFLKKYAQHLRVDLSTVIDDYQPEVLPLPLDERRTSAIAEKLEAMFTIERVRRIGKIIGILLIIFVLVKAVQGIGRWRANARRNAPAVSQAKKTSVQPPATAPSTGAASTAATKTAAQPATAITPKTDKVRVSVRAKKSSWLRVTVDGSVVFQSTLRRGSAETWVADDTIELSGRDINLLEFEHNGKVIGSLGRAERRVKSIIFTKDGFSVQE